VKRYMIAIEGEIPVLESDLTDEDFDNVGLSLDEQPQRAYERAAKYAASRIVAHTGLYVNEAQFIGADER